MTAQAKLVKARHHRHMRHDGKRHNSNLLNFVKQQASRLGAKATANIALASLPANGNTITIAGKVYTFQTALTNVDGNILIGASTAATLTNLTNAINASGGVPGTDYAAAMTANASVSASGATVVTAKSGGTSGNAIAMSTNIAGATVPATLAAGTNFDTWTALHKYTAQRIRSATSSAQLP